MDNNLFRFKQFSIQQDNAAMKVGTDGTALGAWSNCSHTKKALDIGTGTGVIALMLAQRSGAIVDAVEIDNNAIIDAKANFANSPWKNRIRLHHTPIQYYKCDSKYDLIVSNPPYFTNSLKAGSQERTNARHDDGLSTKDLFFAVQRLINKQGRFCVILPADVHENYINNGKEVQLFCSKKLWLKPTPTKNRKRVLLEFSTADSGFTEDEIIIEDKGRHQYSNEYKALTKAFYLNF